MFKKILFLFFFEKIKTCPKPNFFFHQKIKMGFGPVFGQVLIFSKKK
jgi:hypothetical protein